MSAVYLVGMAYFYLLNFIHFCWFELTLLSSSVSMTENGVADDSFSLHDNREEHVDGGREGRMWCAGTSVDRFLFCSTSLMTEADSHRFFLLQNPERPSHKENFI